MAVLFLLLAFLLLVVVAAAGIENTDSSTACSTGPSVSSPKASCSCCSRASAS